MTDDKILEVPTPGATVTETAPNPEPVEDSNPQVRVPLNQAKPYDDEVFDEYEADSAEESVDGDSRSNPDTKPAGKTEEAPKEAAPEKTEEKVEGAKSKEGDKVEDNFEKVVIERTVNGKPFKFTVEDAIKAKLGQEEFNRNQDRRIGDVARREKAFEAEQKNLQGVLNRVIEAAQGGDFVTTIKALAKMAAGSSGLDVTKFEKQYFDQLDKVREVYTKMTPEQREAYFAKRAAEEAKGRVKQLEEEKEAEASKSQLQAQVESLQEKHKVPPDEFWGNYEKLKSGAVGEGKRFKSPEEITAEEVINFTLLVRHEEKVVKACKQAGIEDQATLDELSRITASDPTLTVDEMVKILATAGAAKQAPAEMVENLNRRAAKSNTRPTSQANSTKKQNGIPEGYDEETMEFLYRKQPRTVNRPVR